jgi:hypothetical protein
VTLLELTNARRHNTCWPGVGASETPELRTLPWDKPSPVELRKEARMGKVQEWALFVGLLGGALGIYLSLKAIRGKK